MGCSSSTVWLSEPGRRTLRVATVLCQRITDQVMVPGDPERDAAVRTWRLAQVARCVAAEAELEAGTEVLDATRSPEVLAARIAAWIRR